jgi:CHRD domain
MDNQLFGADRERHRRVLSRASIYHPERRSAVPVSSNLIMTGPIEGAATLTVTEAADLMSGHWYFNICSADHKGGEMRGQVLKGM